MTFSAITYLVCKLRHLQEEPLEADKYGRDPSQLLVAERYVTARCKALPFYATEHMEFLVDAFPKYHMDLHVGHPLTKVLHSVTNSELAVQYTTESVRKWVRHHVDWYLDLMQRGRLKGFVLEHGHKPIGGFFVGVFKARSALYLAQPFLRRGLLHSVYAIRLLAEYIRTVSGRDSLQAQLHERVPQRPFCTGLVSGEFIKNCGIHRLSKALNHRFGLIQRFPNRLKP